MFGQTLYLKQGYLMARVLQGSRTIPRLAVVALKYPYKATLWGISISSSCYKLKPRYDYDSNVNRS